MLRISVEEQKKHRMSITNSRNCTVFPPTMKADKVEKQSCGVSCFIFILAENSYQVNNSPTPKSIAT